MTDFLTGLGIGLVLFAVEVVRHELSRRQARYDLAAMASRVQAASLADYRRNAPEEQPKAQLQRVDAGDLLYEGLAFTDMPDVPVTEAQAALGRIMGETA